MKYLSFDIECCDGKHICEFGYVIVDEKFNTIDEVLEKMKELGHNVYGEIKMKTWHNENKIVIESIMY